MDSNPPLATYRSRRRVRLLGMAVELGISERKMREFLTLGMPYTQLMGIIWLEPAEVHSWLDKFKRRSKGRKANRAEAFRGIEDDEQDVEPEAQEPLGEFRKVNQ